MSEQGLLASAEQAVDLAQSHPGRASRLAGDVLSAAEPTVDAEAASVAERALGLVARTRGDLVGARRHLERAIETAGSIGLTVRAAEARTSLVLVLASQGALDEALRQADLCRGVLKGAAAAHLSGQRALLAHRLGRHEEALAGYRGALLGLRRAGDAAGEARSLCNRGVLHAQLGDYRAAEADLSAAERLHRSLGRILDVAEVHHNLGFVAARRGDVPAALRWFDLAETVFRAEGVPRPECLLDRCETLLAVRLVSEARQVGETAVAELAASGAEMDLAEARLLLSEAALLDDDPGEASAQAAMARDAFVDQQRPGWAALARYAGLRAAWAAVGHGPENVEVEAVAAAEELAAAGWVVPAQDARLIAARAAIEAGRPDRATACLNSAAAARFRGPADLRARAWHAEALLRSSRGEGRGAEAALRAGLRVLARNRATLGATELRVHATARAADLATLGTRLALQSGRARRVLGWAERLRAGHSGGTRAPRPPADNEVAEHLAELRHVVSRLEQAGFAGEDPARLLRRQAALEAQIRRRTRHAVGDPAGEDARPPSVAALASGLGDRALVELVASDGELGAVTVVDGRACLHRLASESDVASATETLRFALGRLARDGTSSTAQRAAASLATEASARLDQLVFDPVRRRIGDRPLVLVPTGSLHAVPWAALPTCRARPVAVSPSATGWLRASQRQRDGAGAGGSGASGGSGGSAANGHRREVAAGAVLVAGPGLAHAGPEVADLADVHCSASTLRGSEATTAAFLGVVNGAELVHVAAHGRFRSDNPLLSSLRLADGPLTVYDLEHLDQAPRKLVLSACEAGLSAAHPGDELMGLAASLLALGSRTLVASVVAVSDVATRSLMVDLHRRLVTGAEPAEALARAQSAVRAEEPGALSAAGFVCFGAG